MCQLPNVINANDIDHVLSNLKIENGSNFFELKFL